MTLVWQAEGDRRPTLGAKANLDLLRQAVEVRPQNPRYHYDLAFALSLVEDFEGCIAAFGRGLAYGAPEPGEVEAYLMSLIATDRASKALAEIDGRFQALVERPGLRQCRGIARIRQGDLEAGEADLRAAIAAEPMRRKAVTELTKLLRTRGDWEGLVALGESVRAQGFFCGPAIRALIDGLVGLGRREEAAEWLDFDTFVEVLAPAAPPGFADLAAFNRALAADLQSPHKIRLHDVPRLALTGGEQVEDLEIDSSPAMAALLSMLRREIEGYARRSRGRRQEVLREMQGASLRLGAWALLLGPQDTQNLHYHLHSTVAGVYYVDAPADVLRGDGTNGCLVIPSEEEGLGAPRFIAPVPGRLVLFPGYVFHRTTPTHAAGLRISIAFDVAAVSAPVGEGDT